MTKPLHSFFVVCFVLAVMCAIGLTSPPSKPPPAPASQPAVKLPISFSSGSHTISGFLKQPQQSIAIEMFGGSLIVKDFGVSQGGILLAHGGENVSLTNVWSEGKPGSNTSKPGCYAVIAWDKGVDTFTWDNSGLAKYLQSIKRDPSLEWIQQGPSELAARFKVHHLRVIGCKFDCSTHPDAHGKQQPVKQVVGSRDGEPNRKGSLHEYIDCIFNGPFQGGRQLDPGGDGQHLDKLSFTRCTFLYGSAAHPIVRNPGIDHVIYTDCIDEHGKKFSRTE